MERGKIERDLKRREKGEWRVRGRRDWGMRDGERGEKMI